MSSFLCCQFGLYKFHWPHVMCFLIFIFMICMNVDIDECVSGPCGGNATCNDMMNGYQCICPLGFNGDTCNEG